MILKAFVVYDTKSCVYENPFFVHTPAAAVRMFSDISNDKQHPIGAHPEDYILYEVGTYDNATGLLAPHAAPHPLGHASDYVRVLPVHPGKVEPVNGDKKLPVEVLK